MTLSARSGEPGPPSRAGAGVGVWFTSTFATCFIWSFLFSTWVSRGAEVKSLLDLNTVQFGLLAMVYPLGALAGVSFASAMVRRCGSRVLTAVCFVTAPVSLAVVGAAVDGGHLWLAVVALTVLGPPLAMADYIANYEGTRVDRVSTRSVLPAIHSAFGLGMLSAAALAGFLSEAGVPLDRHFAGVAAGALLIGGAAAAGLPRAGIENESGRAEAGGRVRTSPWRERRTLIIAFIGFAFVMAETAALIWVPIALTGSGFTSARAAFALSVFWVVVTVVRLVGGLVVDAIGRRRTLQVAAAVAAVGICIFMATDVIGVPYVGLVLWAAGLAMGFTMAVSAMGDDPSRAPARINMLISIVYLANVSVGSVIGAAGQVVGVYTAMGVPVLLLIVAMAAAKSVDPPREPQPETN